MGFFWIGIERTDAEGNKTWAISVRSLVAPLVQEGSISFGVSGMALRRGVELHARIQRERAQIASDYQKEVTYAQPFEVGARRFEISGRVDGRWDRKPVLMEEIKTTTRLSALERLLVSFREHPYILQIQTYAYLHFVTFGDIPKLQLLLVSAYDDSRVVLPVDFFPETYRIWLDQRLADLDHRLVQQTRFFQARRKLAQGLRLPFSQARPGQDELCRWIDEGASTGKHILIQAPTGLGKTVGVLLGTLRDAFQHDRQVFFVTPKNTQHRLVAETARRFRDAGTPLTALVIRAREKACFQDEVVCDPEFCPYADSYYDKLGRHDLSAWMEERGVVTPEIIADWARREEVCPYQLSLDLLPHADLVVCDYNYVFSPGSSLFRWDTERPADCANLIIDECHNVHERARDYFSPRLGRPEIAGIRRRTQKLVVATRRRVRRWLTDLDRLILSHDPSRSASSRRITLNMQPFFRLEKRLGGLLAEHLGQVDQVERNDPLLELMRLFFDFCHALRAQNERSVFLIHGPAERAYLEIVCCDPSPYLRQQLRPFFAVVGVSATIKPFSFYALVSGLDPDRLVTREFPNPFPRTNRKILIVPQVSTLFRDRERNAGRIAQALSRILPLKKGNYVVFFPSFGFLKQVAVHIDLPRFRIFEQTPGMSPRQRAKLLAKLEQKTKNVVLLAVQGGIFAEGIDLPGTRLIGAVIVGPGLPAFDVKRECLRDYFQDQYGQGFEFAYVFPGMARSIQAAGRVIRSEDDQGLLIFLDRRFLSPVYGQVFPRDWYDQSPEELVSTSILNDVAQFWRAAGSGKRQEAVRE